MSNPNCRITTIGVATSRRTRARFRARPGVSMIETLIVLIMIGTMTAFALPKVRVAQTHEATRNARREVQAAIARAKGVAVNRSCRATLHIRQDTRKIWVTACKITGTGLDTLGGVVYLGSRYGITMTSDGDSIPFGPNSLGKNTATINLGFTKSGYTSALQITPIGRPVW